MKKWVSLLVAGMLVSIAPVSAAADFTAQVCVEQGAEVHLKLDNLGDSVFSVNGYVEGCVGCGVPERPTALSGSAVLEDPNTLRVGVTLHQTDLSFLPVIWDFVVDPNTLIGAGFFEQLTLDEVFGNLEVAPSPCPALSTTERERPREFLGER